MAISIAQLDAHLKTMKGKHNYWPGIGGHQCMVVFASINKLFGGPAYAAPGAKDLWNNPELAAGYVQLPASTAPQFGDVAVYGNTWGDGWGHVAVAISNINTGSYNGFGQNPAVASTTVLSKAGLLGWLRPRALAAAPVAKPAVPALVNRTLKQAGMVRTAPNHTAPLAPGYPNGLSAGAVLSVRGYVVGTRPYPGQGNAWLRTKSGYYVWIGAIGSSLAGLAKL